MDIFRSYDGQPIRFLEALKRPLRLIYSVRPRRSRTQSGALLGRHPAHADPPRGAALLRAALYRAPPHRGGLTASRGRARAMNILFAMDRRVDAGSIQAVHNYVRAGDECGHRFALFGKPDRRFPPFATHDGRLGLRLPPCSSSSQAWTWMDGLRNARVPRASCRGSARHPSTPTGCTTSCSSRWTATTGNHGQRLVTARVGRRHYAPGHRTGHPADPHAARAGRRSRCRSMATRPARGDLRRGGAAQAVRHPPRRPQLVALAAR